MGSERNRAKARLRQKVRQRKGEKEREEAHRRIKRIAHKMNREKKAIPIDTLTSNL